MARHRHEEPHDEDFDEDDLPDGVYHDDEPAMVACPFCREPVYEEAQYCPRCENYLSTEDRGGSNPKPFWMWVCLILALAASLVAVFL